MCVGSPSDDEKTEGLNWIEGFAPSIVIISLRQKRRRAIYAFALLGEYIQTKTLVKFIFVWYNKDEQ